MQSNDAEGRQLDDVLALFARYQRRLHAYIGSMLSNPAEADEVLQETNIVVWKKFQQFEPATDFRAWVFQIAYYEVRKHLERKQRNGVTFSPDLLDELSAEYQSREGLLEERRETLTGCVQKLRADDRELVERVYGQGVDVGQLAEQTGREKTSIYRSLRRIRQLLFECVERTLGAQGNP